ncbi:hypothetical protein [Actinophytocola oryzae]|uniref:Uncharacterized protein n=1 Tax=Actinophytocola oryzae TaxID=502181 RepID=A0A4R7VAX0_9PSEU|nr:hypothetical protein [Actinophytocola oryzae]TDV46115.1 hypothetical protein CLV71_11173 [Actinophytocola oryzae]
MRPRLAFALAVVAGTAAATLTVVVVERGGPESCRSCAVVDPASLVSPERVAPARRKGGLPSCLVGSWQVVAEREVIKFYIDADPLPFTYGGGHRSYEFRPDGQVVERDVDFTMVGNHRGQEVRTVRNGERVLTWSATERTLTYHSLAATSLVVDYYDRRGRLDPGTETPDPSIEETDDISCTGNQVVESGTRESGYSATWQRTGDYGVYG